MIRFIFLAFCLQFVYIPAPALGDEPFPIICAIPTDLGEVVFGDPVYIPVSFINRSDQPVKTTSLKRHAGAVFFDISCGTSHLAIHYDGGMGGVSTVEIPVGGSCTTVLLVNLWTPEFASEFVRLGEATIEITPYDATVYADSHRQGVLKLSENAVRGTIPNALIEMDAAIKGDESRHRMRLDGSRGWSFSPFWNFTTPLSWDTTLSDEGAWTNPDSPLVMNAINAVKDGTRLERLLDLSLALKQIESTYDFPDVVVLTKQVISIVKECDRLERQWFIGRLSAQVMFHGCCSNSPSGGLHRTEMIEILLDAFPDASSQFLLDSSYSVLSRSTPYFSAE